jgi:hypothetical protein
MEERMTWRGPNDGHGERKNEELKLEQDFNGSVSGAKAVGSCCCIQATELHSQESTKVILLTSTSTPSSI